MLDSRSFPVRLLGVAVISLALQLAVGLCSAPAEVQTRAQQEHLRRLQYLLLWSGDYFGPLDGQPGALLGHAIRNYQSKSGFRTGEALDAAQLRHLSELAHRAMRQVDYGHEPDAAGGGYVAVPHTILNHPSAGGTGARYHTADDALEIETVRRSSETPTFLELYRSMLHVFDADSLTTNIFGGDYFIISGRAGDTVDSMRFEERGNEIRGIKIRFRRDSDSRYPWLAKAMLQDFTPFGEPAPIGPAPALPVLGPAMRSSVEPEQAAKSSGTGFVVTSHGHVLTNAHVVLSCDDIRVGNNRPARLVAIQNGEDLALLQVADLNVRRVADFAGAEVLLGEDVAVFGFPLRPILAEQLNMTTGIVSSLRGLRGDPTFIQISASVQPGNSGGPVVDLKGRVVGIVTSVLVPARNSRRPDWSHAPINFAIRHERMLRFLRAEGIEPKIASNSQTLEKTELAAQASIYTVPITCQRR